jgi:hypothetical protein
LVVTVERKRQDDRADDMVMMKKQLADLQQVGQASQMKLFHCGSGRVDLVT